MTYLQPQQQGQPVGGIYNPHINMHYSQRQSQQMPGVAQLPPHMQPRQMIPMPARDPTGRFLPNKPKGFGGAPNQPPGQANYYVDPNMGQAHDEFSDLSYMRN